MSSATSWHSFKRDFLQRTNRAVNLSPNLWSLRKAVRVKDHFDLLVLERLSAWDNTRDVLAKDWQSNETQVREANLQWATLQMLVLLVMVLVRFFVEFSFMKLHNAKSSGNQTEHIIMQKIMESSETSATQLMLLMFMSLCVVVPMLITRNNLGRYQKQNVKLLEKIQHRCNIIQIHNKSRLLSALL